MKHTNDNTTSIEQLLLDDGVVTYKVKGKSMEPMIIQNKDIVTIRKIHAGENYQVNDVVLYHQKGHLVLHRIVEIQQDGRYVILGDNCSRKEYDVKDSDIIGKLKSFKHNGKHYDLNDTQYTQYVEILEKTQKIRMIRKLLYDIIIQHLNFLPSSFYDKLKVMLKGIIVYQIKFD